MRRDAWTWAATLTDGRTIREADVGTFKAVDLAECVAVDLIPRHLLRKPIRVTVDPLAGQRAVFFRRRRLRVKITSGESRVDPTVTVAGWESDVGNGYIVASDNGRILATADRDGA